MSGMAGEIGGATISDPPIQTEVHFLRDKTEDLTSDLRNLSTRIHSLRSALLSDGLIKGSA
jgi:hypothetical protein